MKGLSPFIKYNFQGLNTRGTRYSLAHRDVAFRASLCLHLPVSLDLDTEIAGAPLCLARVTSGVNGLIGGCSLELVLAGGLASLAATYETLGIVEVDPAILSYIRCWLEIAKVLEPHPHLRLWRRRQSLWRSRPWPVPWTSRRRWCWRWQSPPSR